ncbi:tyrosine-type recombinase/integrase [Arthrobacter zhaoguopingii]|uniref:tyrosine-type recombinase/integrase n=1 Tax=Arthrobacter zhaoguopingii TaxID=2681491 RepID=UPI00135CC7EA|nr:site-specific integrase [Arthrobacter zhaoguopingii]
MSPRPPLPLGTWGKISRKKHPNGRWRATTRYRDTDGITRTAEAWGTSGAAAERTLVTSFQDRRAPISSEISRTTRLSELSDLWFEEIENNGRAGRRTIDGYRDTYRRVIEPALAGLRLHELSTGRIDRFLKNVAADHPATARHSKIVLTGMIGLALRHDAVRSNPVRDVGPIKIARKDVKALSVEDVQKLRTVIDEWQKDPTHQGRPRAADLLDVLDIFLATGARIGEVLAIRWQDVDLQAEPPTITISGTVVMEKGRGAYRQDHPKTKAGFRTMKVPPFAVQTLQRRYSAERPKPEDMLFPSSTGTVRSPHNFRRQWRDARAGSPYEWVTPHVFRKSVATLINQEYSSRQAAAQLGHSGTAITEKHYIAKATESPDLTATLQQFGDESPLGPDHLSM